MSSAHQAHRVNWVLQVWADAQRMQRWQQLLIALDKEAAAGTIEKTAHDGHYGQGQQGYTLRKVR